MAEAIATVCFTQNRSIIHHRFNKTPYELINGRKPDISFLYVFGALCYPKNDREDIGKLGAKGDIGLFIGYSADSCAYRIYNRRTKKIMETMNVSFDELSAMAFEQRSSKPGLQTTVENVPPAQEPQVRQTSTASTTIADNVPIPTNSSSIVTNILSSSQDVDELNPNAMIDGNTFVNPFSTSSSNAANTSSSQNVDPSNMLLTRNQLRSDGDMRMYALTVGGSIDIDGSGVGDGWPLQNVNKTAAAYNTMAATRASPWNQTEASGSGLNKDQEAWSREEDVSQVTSTGSYEVCQEISTYGGNSWSLRAQYCSKSSIGYDDATDIDGSGVGEYWPLQHMKKVGGAADIDGSGVSEYRPLQHMKKIWSTALTSSPNIDALGHFARIKRRGSEKRMHHKLPPQDLMKRVRRSVLMVGIGGVDKHNTIQNLPSDMMLVVLLILMVVVSVNASPYNTGTRLVFDVAKHQHEELNRWSTALTSSPDIDALGLFAR
nr:putative RNA-directed DNA polymerase [Tanacetum cinerariifolium]